MKRMFLAVTAILLFFSPGNGVGADGKIIHDAEYAIIEAQNGEQ